MTSLIAAAVAAASIKYGLDPRLIHTIIDIESSGNPNAIGRTHGELGLMQIRPTHHSCASFDIFQNIDCGARYLAKVKAKRKPEWGCYWPVAYNYGINAELRYPERTPYAKKIVDRLGENWCDASLAKSN